MHGTTDLCSLKISEYVYLEKNLPHKFCLGRSFETTCNIPDKLYYAEHKYLASNNGKTGL
jgi:hypothetical protein